MPTMLKRWLHLRFLRISVQKIAMPDLQSKAERSASSAPALLANLEQDFNLNNILLQNMRYSSTKKYHSSSLIDLYDTINGL